MGAMARPSAADAPTLKASDLACEATFADYCDAHQYVDVEGLRGYLRRDAFESGFVRRRAWLAARKGVSAREVTEGLRARVRDLLAERPDAPPAAAWAYATKLAVAIESCVCGAPAIAAPESAVAKFDRKARELVAKASRKAAA
jgi:hypothetical protein